MDTVAIFMADELVNNNNVFWCQQKDFFIKNKKSTRKIKEKF